MLRLSQAWFTPDYRSINLFHFSFETGGLSNLNCGLHGVTDISKILLAAVCPDVIAPLLKPPLEWMKLASHNFLQHSVFPSEKTPASVF